MLGLFVMSWSVFVTLCLVYSCLGDGHMNSVALNASNPY